MISDSIWPKCAQSYLITTWLGHRSSPLRCITQLHLDFEGIAIWNPFFLLVFFFFFFVVFFTGLQGLNESVLFNQKTLDLAQFALL